MSDHTNITERSQLHEYGSIHEVHDEPTGRPGDRDEGEKPTPEQTQKIIDGVVDRCIEIVQWEANAASISDRATYACMLRLLPRIERLRRMQELKR